MSLDLGDLATLASALGLLDDGGNLAPDWFSRPGYYLTQVLREAHQRESLVTFAGDLLGGGQPVADSQGRQWLPVAHAGGSAFTVYAVIGPDGPVIEAGAGARLDVTSAGGVRCQAEVHVPLFGQPTAGGAADRPDRLGGRDGGRHPGADPAAGDPDGRGRAGRRPAHRLGADRRHRAGVRPGPHRAPAARRGRPG